MASTPISNNYPSLVLLSQRCANGAASVGPAIPLLINTAAVIVSDRAAMLTAQAAYQSARGELPVLYQTMRAARENANRFGFSARNVLEFYLGHQHNAAWAAAGFVQWAIPQTEAGLLTLVQALQTYFAANPNQQNVDLQVTAAEAQELVDDLVARRQELDAKLADVAAKSQVRDAKVHTLKKRLRGLCKELKQRLEPLDPRWREFGLNLPGAPTVPAVPRNVAVMALSDGRLQVSCDPSVNAEYYRFFYQRLIVDPEPISAGSANDPLFLIPDLAAGQPYFIFVSAVNSGAESELSSAVSATPVQAAAA